MITSPGARGEYSASRVTLVLLAALLAVQLGSLWSVSHVPTQDGPVHLEIAAQLERLAEGGGIIDRYYDRNPRPEPNALVYPLLAGLAKWVGWSAAEKILLSLCLIGLPAALAYAVSAQRRDAVFLALLALPLSANYLFHMGFVNFALSVPLGLVALGFGLRRPRLRVGSLLVLAGLLLTTCVAHAVSACAVIAALVVASAWRRAEAGADWPARVRGALRGTMAPLVASLPALVLVGSFVAGPSHHAMLWEAPLDLARRLALLHVLVSYDRRELLPAAGCALLLALAGVWRLAGRRALPREERGDSLLAALTALLVLYFTLPASLAGGGYLNPRLQLWLVLVGVVWLSGAPWSGGHRRFLVVATCALSLLFIGLHAAAYRRLAAPLDELTSILPALESERTAALLSFLNRDELVEERMLAGYKIRPFEHALGYLACRKALVDLTEYQADQGYFPIVYDVHLNPYRVLLPEEGLPEDALAAFDWRGYEARGGRVDYVVLWARNPARQWPGEHEFVARLEADFERVFTSRPRGLAEVYRRRAAPR